MQVQIESLMYQIGQLFLLPTLLLIALLFLYAFYCAGAFLMEARSHNAGGRLPLAAWLERNPDVSDDELDVYAHKLLELPRIASRVAPMLGLVATMIPMGPALKALSEGNLANVSDNLAVAFSAVILALIAASITFWVVSVRRRWLAEEMAAIMARRRSVHRGAQNVPTGAIAEEPA
ncbi:MAG: MotA/TolQ/ExbB proton channel family protein [Chromatiales bacterium]|nr:MotA/TolQ/ExbB proton channel family protein [Chromatiales bacterium]